MVYVDVTSAAFCDDVVYGGASSAGRSHLGAVYLSHTGITRRRINHDPLCPSWPSWLDGEKFTGIFFWFTDFHPGRLMKNLYNKCRRLIRRLDRGRIGSRFGWHRRTKTVQLSRSRTEAVLDVAAVWFTVHGLPHSRARPDSALRNGSRPPSQRFRSGHWWKSITAKIVPVRRHASSGRERPLCRQRHLSNMF